MLLKKSEQLNLIREDLKKLNNERVNKLSYIRSTDTMEKFKIYQNQLIEVRMKLVIC